MYAFMDEWIDGRTDGCGFTERLFIQNLTLDVELIHLPLPLQMMDLVHNEVSESAQELSGLHLWISC